MRGEALRTTREKLGENGRLLLLIATFLFLLTVAVFIFSLGNGVMLLFSLETANGSVLPSAAADLLLGLSFFFLFLPLCFGRIAVAGRMCVGESPVFKDIFCFFTDRKSYRRALGICLVILLELLAVSLLFFGVTLIFQAVFGELTVGATLLSALLTALFAAALLLPALPFTAIAVGNPTLPVFKAFRLSLRVGFSHYGETVCFALSHLWRLLLGLLTVGVLQLLWFDPLFTLSYPRFSMALCPKGDLQ